MSDSTGHPEPEGLADDLGHEDVRMTDNGSAGGEGHAARRARSVSNHPQEEARPQTVRRVPRARRMSLSVTRVNAWSVAKVSLMLSVAGGLIQVVAVAVLWLILKVAGIFDRLTQIVSSTGLDAGNFDLTQILSLPTFLSAVTIFSVIEVVLFTVLATIGALLYNVVSSLVGGVHVTLGDD